MRLTSDISVELAPEPSPILDLAPLDGFPVSGLTKGLPPQLAETPLAAIGGLGLNLLKGDLPLPAAVLRRSALEANRRWMRSFLSRTGAFIAPHGKSTMAPQIFEMQLQDGAWGMTCATVSQLAVYRRFGVGRVFFANQLVGRASIRFVLDQLAQDPAFDFYCLVDTLEGVRLLASAVAAHGLARPLNVLVEVGAPGRRTGARTVDAALAVAREAAASPHLALRGVEAFEGVFGDLAQTEKEAAVARLTETMRGVADGCLSEAVFAEGAVILTAGGSEMFDMAAGGLAAWAAERDFLVLLRSGCYIAHDNLTYERAYRRMLERDPSLGEITPGLTPALEVWACVQSRPEPGRAFATMGKRDVSFDVDLPKPVKWFRPGVHTAPQPAPESWRVTALNDQHAFVDLPEDADLAVGDMIGFGVSHICTTFDRWQLLLEVDDDYTVVGGIRTFF